MPQIPCEDLARAPLLAGLSAAQLARVTARAQRIALADGAWLFTQGDRATRFFFVRQGRMRLFRLSAQGDEKVIEFVAAGQTFAEALMFLDEPYYPVCAAALGPTTVIALDAGDFAAMLRDSVETCFILLGHLSRRLRGLIGEIDTLGLHSAASRLARYLVSICPATRADLELPVAKQLLAARLSLQPETLSRAIRRLSEQGAIAIDGQHIRILDRPALEELGAMADSAALGFGEMFGPAGNWP